MGMFDSLYDEVGHDWQTKAYSCALDRYRIGDTIPSVDPASHQVEILGNLDGPFVDSYATIRDRILVAVDVPRDATLPLIDYHGYIAAEGL